ncbi:dienelactone hydrolase family protein [Paenibacillus sp. GCM10023252]|uniref:dienelactone hydrolase family protein n=1 Tax=Paenibacillus sp. GCM10023252 TaxID=3252649 RepID=UPI00360D9BBD
MTLIRESISYGKNLQYKAYTARLEGLKGASPAVIVLQEIWGVDEHIQSVVDRLAAAGYVAFAPELFTEDGSYLPGLSQQRIAEAKSFLNTLPPSEWRKEEVRKPELAKRPIEEAAAIEDTLSRIFNLSDLRPTFIAKVIEAAEFLRKVYSPTAGQGIASVGFCLGGALSAELAAADSELRGAVLFYGGLPDGDKVKDIEAPLLGFYGELDERITSAVPAFAEEVTSLGKSFEYHVYSEAQHAFFNDTRPSYQAAAARDAFARTLGFLNQVLNNKSISDKKIKYKY